MSFGWPFESPWQMMISAMNQMQTATEIRMRQQEQEARARKLAQECRNRLDNLFIASMCGAGGEVDRGELREVKESPLLLTYQPSKEREDHDG